MKPSTKDEVAGKIHEVKGAVKEKDKDAETPGAVNWGFTAVAELRTTLEPAVCVQE